MRIGTQNIEGFQNHQASSTKSASNNKPIEDGSTLIESTENQIAVTIDSNQESSVKEKLKEAIDSINDFLHLDRKSSKFVLHEGLNKYYVRLVDEETEEVIKEIPPERLLNAFYEMQKLAGMIVDEKI